MEIKQIAQVAHEVNMAYCKSIGDFSQPAWDDAPEWQKESAVNGVTHHQQNPDTTPEQSHNVWLAEKAACGWKYGDIKDQSKKEHPCFLPYDELPSAQKSKDYIFSQVVKSMSNL